MAAGRVRAGDPARAGDDARVEEVAHRVPLGGLPRRRVGRAVRGRLAARVRAEHLRADVALDELGVGGEVGVRGRLDLGGLERRADALEVDLAVARQPDDDDLAAAVRVRQREHDVLQRVGRRPRAVLAGVARVRELDERGDGRGVGRVLDVRGRGVGVVDRLGHRRDDGLDVRGVAPGRAHERVLADRGRGEELLGARPAHRAGRGGDDDVLEPEPVEDAPVRRALRLVRALEALVRRVERVRVLHDELAPADEARAGTRLVAVLRLDLVDRQRQVLVRRVQVLDEEREHLLVGGREEVVAVLAVLEAEDVRPVLRPAARRLVRLLGSSAGKCTSCAPAAAISSRTTSSTLRSTRRPSGSQV